MKTLRLAFFSLALVLCSLKGDELNVFAAASLSDALKELAPAFAELEGHTLRFNFGASGALSRQIKEGAPADLIFSADELRVDQLEKAGLLLDGSRRTLLLNQLVVVVGADNKSLSKVEDLTESAVRRIAIGDPATVPVGTYTKEYLGKIGLWTPLREKLVPVDTVRAALAAVEAGNADAGFVYKTDALISKKAAVAFAVPLADGPKITYPAAVLKGTKNKEASLALLRFLSGEEARKVFARYGFLEPDTAR